MGTVSVDKSGLYKTVRFLGIGFFVFFVGYNSVSLYNIYEHERQAASVFDTTTQFTSEEIEDEETKQALSEQGKYVQLDLINNYIALYDSTDILRSFSITTPTVTSSLQKIPKGIYTVDEKVKSELSTITMVRFPFFVKFGDTYALHGRPEDADGEALKDAYGGSLIELQTDDAETVYNFVEAGMPIYVRNDTSEMEGVSPEEQNLDGADKPATSALSYALKDVSTGETYLVKNGDARYPIASITKLVTAAVATDVIGHGTEVFAPDSEYYTLSELYYPLLLRSDNRVAKNIATHSGLTYFMSNMNAYVHALGMRQSTFADASGLSPKNISTANDLILFAEHLYKEKPFIFDITKEESMTITSRSGREWDVVNQNKLASDPHFRGGKLGFTDEAGQTSLAIFNVPLGDEVHPIAVVVLNSRDWKQDTRTLLRWLVENAK